MFRPQRIEALMAGASVTIDLTQLDDALAALSGPIDVQPAFKGVRQLLVSATQDNFTNQSTPDGQPWCPLKKPRRRKRDLVRGKKRGRAKKGQDRILLDTGLLRTSVTAAGSPFNINVAGPTSLEWGTSLEYAAVHNYGYPPQNIPQRQYLGINQGLADDIAELVSGAVEREIAKQLRA
jgi:phage gpG-like protein